MNPPPDDDNGWSSERIPLSVLNTILEELHLPRIHSRNARNDAFVADALRRAHVDNNNMFDRCPVCLNRLVFSSTAAGADVDECTAIVFSCSHLMCANCFLSWLLHMPAGVGQCPSCRVVASEFQPVYDIDVATFTPHQQRFVPRQQVRRNFQFVRRDRQRQQRQQQGTARLTQAQRESIRIFITQALAPPPQNGEDSDEQSSSVPSEVTVRTLSTDDSRDDDDDDY